MHSILHVGKYYSPASGGMETYVRDLAIRQAQVARVSVIVSNNTRRFERIVMDGVTVTRVKRFGTIASMPVCPGLASAIRQSPADIVHIHTPNPAAALAFLMSGHPGKLVLTHHADTMGRRFLRQLSDPFVRRLMNKASRIIVTSHRYLESSPELRPFREKCCVVPLGIEIHEAGQAEMSAASSLRNRFPGRPLILAVGRLVPYKGFDVLIRAMKSLSAQLLLVGTGPEERMLKRLASIEGVSDRVTLMGQVDSLGYCFAAASVFVLPSVTRAEAFGIVQLEAMAAGLPVVNTDIDSGVPEICAHGETGITVKPGDPIELSSAIRMLLDSPDLREKLGRAARARVKAEYAAEQMAQRTISVYSSILGQGLEYSEKNERAINPD